MSNPFRSPDLSIKRQPGDRAGGSHVPYVSPSTLKKERSNAPPRTPLGANPAFESSDRLLSPIVRTPQGKQSKENNVMGAQVRSCLPVQCRQLVSTFHVLNSVPGVLSFATKPRYPKGPSCEFLGEQSSEHSAAVSSVLGSRFVRFPCRRTNSKEKRCQVSTFALVQEGMLTQCANFVQALVSRVAHVEGESSSLKPRIAA